VEDCGVLILVILCIPFLIFVMWCIVSDMNYFKCPISLSNEICNGGTCYTRGSCICRSPLFFGAACNVTLCPGFDARENTVCGGHGVCAEAADGRIRSEPPACTKLDHLTGTRGWDSPKCLAYIKDAEDGIVPFPQRSHRDDADVYLLQGVDGTEVRRSAAGNVHRRSIHNLMSTPHSTKEEPKDEEPKEAEPKEAEPKEAEPKENATRIALTLLGSFAAIVLFIWGMFSFFFALKALVTCPVSLSNEACNGGTCYTSGECSCRSTLFFGSVCNVTLCPGFDPRRNTVCGGHGFCDAPRESAVPPACHTYFPPFAFLKVGWDSPACLAYVAYVAESASGGSTSPTCDCYDGWTGRKCDVPPLLHN
jgi:hypothetical protein